MKVWSKNEGLSQFDWRLERFVPPLIPFGASRSSICPIPLLWSFRTGPSWTAEEPDWEQHWNKKRKIKWADPVGLLNFWFFPHPSGHYPSCVPLITVYLDAVLKSPQRSVVADPGALDAAAGASKSKRISKAEEREKKNSLAYPKNSTGILTVTLKKLLDAGAENLWRDSSLPCRSQTFWGVCYNSISFCWMCTAPADTARVHCLQKLFSLHSANHLTHLSLITSPSRPKAQIQPKLSNHNSCQTGTTLTVQTMHCDHIALLRSLRLLLTQTCGQQCRSLCLHKGIISSPDTSAWPHF